MQYPKWQEQIRKAQTICNQREAEKQAKRDQEKAAEEMNFGRKLARLLGYLGIEVAPPPTREIILDDTALSLLYSPKYVTRNDVEMVSFRLKIAIANPIAPWHDSYTPGFYARDIFRDFQVSDIPLEDSEQWLIQQARLADAIDHVQDNYRTNQERWEECQQRESVAKSAGDLFLEALDNYLEDRFNMRFE